MRIGRDGEHVLRDDGTERIVMSATQSDQGSASSVLVNGSGFISVEQAEAAGQRWTPLLQRAFARLGIGADLGQRRLLDGAALRRSADGPTISDEIPDMQFLVDLPGLTVYSSEPRPVFSQVSSHSHIAQAGQVLASAIADVEAEDAAMSELEQTAFELYSSSFSNVSSDARFIVLMMALETLIEPQPREVAVVTHVDSMIELTRHADLPDAQKQSLLGSLEYMRLDSIGQAGRRLAATLGERHYADMPAVRFFTHCYTLRSRLVHGAHPRPSQQEIDDLAPDLQRMAADLLACTA